MANGAQIRRILGHYLKNLTGQFGAECWWNLTAIFSLQTPCMAKKFGEIEPWRKLKLELKPRKCENGKQI